MIDIGPDINTNGMGNTLYFALPKLGLAFVIMGIGFSEVNDMLSFVSYALSIIFLLGSIFIAWPKWKARWKEIRRKKK